MGAFLGLKKHTAFFYDDSGEFVGSTTFQTAFREGLKKKTFSFNDGTYNIKSRVSRAYVPGFWFSDSYYYSYNINNPDPINFFPLPLPLMSPKDYQSQLDSKVLSDLNKSRKGGLGELLTPRNIIIAVVVLGVLLYLMNGGSLTSPPPQPPA